MPIAPQLAPAPVIAQVISPTAILYALQVYSHNGYVVESRRRGIGPPQPFFEFSSDTEPRGIRYAAYQEYHHPVFNEPALARSGVKREAIEAWLKAPDNDALTHPDFEPLCLRWGDNSEGIYVQEYVVPAGNSEHQIVFTPFSCWRSEITYYRIHSSFSGNSRHEKALKEQGILREHTAEINSEGDWYGWYSTDWVAVQRALAALRLTPVLAQVITHYWVSLYEREDEITWTEHFYLESEALARYAQFRENLAYDAFRTNEYPRLVKGGVSTLRNETIDGWRSGEKVLLSRVATEVARR